MAETPFRSLAPGDKRDALVGVPARGGNRRRRGRLGRPAGVPARRRRWRAFQDILARLAVDRTGQGRGLGRALVKDALPRTAAAADIAGIRALLVHARDDEARAWCEALEFETSPTDPRHLFLLMKDLRAMSGQ